MAPFDGMDGIDTAQRSRPAGLLRKMMDSAILSAMKSFLLAKFKMGLVTVAAHSFIFYLWFTLTPVRAYMTFSDRLRLVYRAQSSRASPEIAAEWGEIISPGGTYFLLCTWLTVLATAISAMLLFMTQDWQLGKDPVTEWSKRRLERVISLFKWCRTKIGNLLSQELAPRFWIPWCGGLNIRDLIIVLIAVIYTAAIVITAMVFRYNRSQESLHAGRLTQWQVYENMYKGAAHALGTVSIAIFTLALYPVPRSSFLHYAFNTEFSTLIKYHRWLGFYLIWLVILHTLMYYAIWLYHGQFGWRWKRWDGGGVNYIAGLVSVLSGALMLLTSMSYVRRYYFQVFIRCHIIGFIGFTIFAYLHWNIRWYYHTPALALLMLDWSFRLAQWLHPSWVTGQFVTADKSIITLNFTWTKAANAKPGHYMFLNIPTGRRFQWHPITIADVDNSHPEHSLVSVHMKCYGAWSTNLMGQMVKSGRVLMRADGPYGQPYGYSWQDHSAMVIIAGGIGATPMLAMLREMAAMRKKQEALEIDSAELLMQVAFPHKVAFHWTCRGMAEFALLDNALLEAHRSSDWLDIHLYCTRSVNRDGVHQETDTLQPEASTSGLAEEDEALSRCSAAGTLGSNPKYASAFRFLPGPLQAYGSGWVWIASHILAFVGAFAGILLAQMYDTNKALEGHRVSQDWKTASLIVVASFVGGFGLPAWLIFGLKLLQKDKFREQHKYAAIQDSREEEIMRPTIISSSHLVGSEEDPTSLQVQDNRPNISDILSACKVSNAEMEDVRVLAAGPSSLVNQVHLSCCDLNRGTSVPVLKFSAHAFEL